MVSPCFVERNIRTPSLVQKMHSFRIFLCKVCLLYPFQNSHSFGNWDCSLWSLPFSEEFADVKCSKEYAPTCKLFQLSEWKIFANPQYLIHINGEAWNKEGLFTILTWSGAGENNNHGLVLSHAEERLPSSWGITPITKDFHRVKHSSGNQDEAKTTGFIGVIWITKVKAHRTRAHTLQKVTEGKLGV